ncbi:MAG: DUF3617 domain-containing protein [Ramlibacter sp.]
MKAQHLLAVVTIGFASAAGAQSLKPGLWEVTQKMHSSSGEMEKSMAQLQEQLAGLPPEQRKKMEEMMASKGMSPASGGAMSVKVCMTKEMVENAAAPLQQHQMRGNCKSTKMERTGNTMKMAYTCTAPPSSGEGEMTFNNPEGYTMKVVVSTTIRGKAEKMNMESTGKWQGADCGAVKPPVMPKQ